jgi:L-ascorbate metabolism protein UlaG (beta-lactamase superfamily)
MLGGLLGAGRGSAAEANQPSGRTFYYSGPLSDHFDGKRFFNPAGRAEPRSFTDVLRWRLSGGRQQWPYPYPSPFAGMRPKASAPGGLRAILVGHATFLIQFGGLSILTDPVWSDRASPFSEIGPRRHNPPGIAFEDLPRIDAVLISHNHYDHLDLPTIERLWQRDRPLIVAPLGNDAIIQARNPDIAVTTLDWGERTALARGVTATAVPAQHWSARTLNDRNHALWAGFVLTARGRTVYFAGDTGFGDGSIFRAVAARHRRIDLALLPIGAYAPRWFMADQHMNPDDAVRAFQLLGARQALGFHWGTFQLTDEGVEEPSLDLTEALVKRAVAASRFLAVRPGQSWAG